jgi:multidrug efflux pump subunit AcrA (membrane-fusion protein)
MYELRAVVGGVVSEVPVDEGQMVAEDDVIAQVDAAGSRFSLVTDVPGVVRELYVERGRAVSQGDVIALIDEA